MIKVEKLNGDLLYINERNIQWIEEVPETLITFLNGKKVKIRISLEDLLDRIHASYQKH